MKTSKKSGPIIGLLVLFILIAALSAVYYLNSNKGIKVYFIKGEKPIAIVRDLPKEEDPLQIAALELMRGPTDIEKQSGIFTEIPGKARIIKAEREGGTAVITFNEEIENYGGGSARVNGLVAQIVYTFTEIPGIKSVKIVVGNKAEVVLGGEGFVIDRPLSREDLNAR